MTAALKLAHNENAINALSRNNNIIKSLFHYKKPITFLMVGLAVQKFKIGAHKNGLVIIAKPEIKKIATGSDTKIGGNELIKQIRDDIHANNFFNLYDYSAGLSDRKHILFKETSITEDCFNDLALTFDLTLLKNFESESNYTIQNIQQLRECRTNQSLIIYTLCQPYAEPTSPTLVFSIDEIKKYLHIDTTAYKNLKNLTLRLQQICKKITDTTDILLKVRTVKRTGRVIGYEFASNFKLKQPAKLSLPTPTLAQQLRTWGVSTEQAKRWLDNVPSKTLKDSITQANNNAKTNKGGYLYSILGKCKTPFRSTQTTTKTLDKELLALGFSIAECKEIKSNLKSYSTLLPAIVDRCKRDKNNEILGTENMRQYFTEMLNTHLRDFIGASATTTIELLTKKLKLKN